MMYILLFMYLGISFCTYHPFCCFILLPFNYIQFGFIVIHAYLVAFSCILNHLLSHIIINYFILLLPVIYILVFSLHILTLHLSSGLLIEFIFVSFLLIYSFCTYHLHQILLVLYYLQF